MSSNAPSVIQLIPGPFEKGLSMDIVLEVGEGDGKIPPTVLGWTILPGTRLEVHLYEGPDEIICACYEARDTGLPGKRESWTCVGRLQITDLLHQLISERLERRRERAVFLSIPMY